MRLSAFIPKGPWPDREAQVSFFDLHGLKAARFEPGPGSESVLGAIYPRESDKEGERRAMRTVSRRFAEQEAR